MNRNKKNNVYPCKWGLRESILYRHVVMMRFLCLTIFNPFLPSGLFNNLTIWTGPFQIIRSSGEFLLLPCLIEIPFFNANEYRTRIDTACCVSDLGVHYLPMSLLRDARIDGLSFSTPKNLHCTSPLIKFERRQFYYLLMCVENSWFVANSVDPVQTPRFRRLIWVYSICSYPSGRKT